MKIKMLLPLLLLTVFSFLAILAPAGDGHRFKLNFDDAYLVYVPGDDTLQIAAQGNVLSYGSDWKVRKIRPYLFGMKQKAWKGFMWKVNIETGEVYIRRGADEDSPTVKEEKLDGIKVEVVGNKKHPQRFLLKFDSAYMAYIPNKNILQLVTEGVVLSYCNDWKVKELKPYLFHFKQDVWKGFFWHVNTSRKSVNMVTGADFGEMGGDLKKLDIEVELY